MPVMDFAFLAALKSTPLPPQERGTQKALWSRPSCNVESFSKDLLLNERQLHGGMVTLVSQRMLGRLGL